MVQFLDILVLILFFSFIFIFALLFYAVVGARRANKLWKVWKNV